MRGRAIPEGNDKIFQKKKFFSKLKKYILKKKKKRRWVAGHPQKALGWQRHPRRASQWTGEPFGGGRDTPRGLVVALWGWRGARPPLVHVVGGQPPI
jgi:hypothetical protein